MRANKRRLGRTDLQIVPIVFGGNVFGWTADEATSFRLLDAWVDAGFNAIDTADVYSFWVEGHSGGESEAVIGRWLKRRGRADDVLLFTKVGWAAGKTEGGNLKAERIIQGCEASLRRLGVERIDLYQAHSDDPTTPMEETLAAFDRLVRDGKVRWIGCSNFTAERLAEALEVSDANGLARYESVQPRYNLLDREGFEPALRDACLANDVGAISYYALAAGFLTGKYSSEADLLGRARAGGAGRYMSAENLQALGALREVAAAEGCTPGQAAVAWLLTRPGLTAPIASATSEDQLQELARALEVGLSADSVAWLDALRA
ncbi:aldo/keto reductase [Brevundimonas sp. 2R-24]|uniref:Aldo/keto reductase n=1 Tax=Peiella sedimenti TaxID=3061083 RepID=A0ABT8SQQ4_9CAUL|nr:aldo/keto reductase [Caulobacteraceae bacterium XZ-24]